jgi:molecular chaperone GrpE
MLNKGPVTKLKDELRVKEKELAEMRSLALRTAAEFDNARKRWTRESEEIRNYASSRLIKDFIEIWDNFERALSSGNHGENEVTFESYRRGVELIFDQFKKTLMSHGLESYSMLGEDFDPARAEAIGYVESPDARPGEVIEELKKGFTLAKRVLRPAQVMVAREVKKSQGPESDSFSGPQGG